MFCFYKFLASKIQVDTHFVEIGGVPYNHFKEENYQYNNFDGKVKTNRNDQESCQNIEERDKIWKKRVKDNDRKLSTERAQNKENFDFELKSKIYMEPNEIHENPEYHTKKNSILQKGEDSSGCYHCLPIELLDGTTTRVICAPKLNPKIGKIASRKRKGLEYLR